MTETNPEIRYFTIPLTLEDIPEPKPCPIDGGQTEKSAIQYQITVQSFIVRAEEAPGYRCVECGAGLYDPHTSISLLAGAASRLNPYTDLDLMGHLLRKALDISGRIKAGASSISGL